MVAQVDTPCAIAGMPTSKHYLARSAAGQDVQTSPLHPLHPFYLRNDDQEVAASHHATHQQLYDVSNPQGSHHFDQLASLALLHNIELLQGSEGANCVDDQHAAVSDLSSEAAFTAGRGARPRAAGTMNAEGMLPSIKAAEYNSITGSMLAMKGAAEILRGTTMGMESSKTIDFRHEGLGAEGAYNAGRNGETMSASSKYGFSAEYPRGNSRVTQLELEQMMSSINAGDNMMSWKHYEVEAGEPAADTALVYRTPRNISMGQNVIMSHAQRSSGSTECGYIPLTVNQNGDHQTTISSEWDNTDQNMAIANAATKELLRLNYCEQAISNVLVPRNVSSIYAAKASNSYDACNAAPAGGNVDLNPLGLLHRSFLHDHSPPIDFAVPGAQHLPGGHHFDTAACTKRSIVFPRRDNHNEMNNHNAIAATNTCLKQETAAHTAPSGSTFLNYFGNLHQETSSPDVGLSLYPQSGNPAQHNIRLCNDLLSLDFPYSRTGSGGVLRCSKYMKAAQQLLEEFCNLKPESTGAPEYSTTTCSPSASTDSPVEAPPLPKQQLSAEERCQWQMRKARLIGMVEELDRRYQQYREQMQLIVTSYESATGMGAAASYTALARKLISRQFRALRDTIAEHIKAGCRTLGEDISSVPVLSKGETPRLRILDQRLRHHRTLQQVGLMSQQHHVWRPQRGLPERSVSVLRAWLFEHFLHPYPKDSEKLMLARLTGLTRNQVANWFINARVRLWKPMVEQMYAEERKEAESQNDAPTLQDGGKRITAYAPSHGNITGMAEAMHVEYTSDGQCCPKPHHYQHLAHGDSKPACTSDCSIMTKDGVSLTLALQQSSSAELEHSTYNPNHYYHLHPVCAEANYSITNAIS